MLFWLAVILLVVGILGLLFTRWIYDHTRYDPSTFSICSLFLVFAALLFIICSLIFLADAYIEADAEAAKNNARYESLVYQLENDLYDNDNDLGKKELYNEIRKWNEELAYYKTMQDDFWLGIYFPNIYDQLEFIEYGGRQ